MRWPLPFCAIPQQAVLLLWTVLAFHGCGVPSDDQEKGPKPPIPEQPSSSQAFDQDARQGEPHGPSAFQGWEQSHTDIPLPAGLDALMLPHWGASTQWKGRRELMMYYVQQDGHVETQYHQTEALEGPKGNPYWSFRVGLHADSACYRLFALRAKIPKPMHEEYGNCWSNTSQEPSSSMDKALPALSLPFWLRQLALHPKAEGAFTVLPEPGSMLPALGFDALDGGSQDLGKSGEPPSSKLDWRVLGTDSVVFQDQRWSTWKLEARRHQAPEGEPALLRVWIERRYPNGIVRWEGIGGQSGQLASRVWTKTEAP